MCDSLNNREYIAVAMLDLADQCLLYLFSHGLKKGGVPPPADQDGKATGGQKRGRSVRVGATCRTAPYPPLNVAKGQY